MANQAIALQARAPQSNILGGAIQQNAQLMNMMAQQRSAERQAARTAQEMQLAQAAEGRAVTAEERAARKAQQEYEVAEVIRLRNRGVSVGDDAGYQMWLSQVEKVSPDDAALYRQYSPTFDPDKMKNIIMEADKFIDKTIATPQASLQVGKDLETYSATVGGLNPRVDPLMVGGATQPAPVDKIETAVEAILKGAGIGNPAISALTPEEFDIAAERANERKAGGGARMQPVSMTAGPQMGGQPDLTAVVQDMMSSGQISQSNLQLMREMAGPEKDAQLAQILKSNNIQIVPDDQPGMRSAVFRPGQDAAPQMQLAQATNAPGTQFRVAKDPMQSPAPGSVLVPTPVIREQEGAKTAGSEDVKVGTQPKIVAGEERARRLEKLRGELPLARSETQTLVNHLDRRIKAIDDYLRDPYRNSIIGAVEGRLPKILQDETRADVQARYDTIVSNTVLNKLIEDRQATETGASPQGIVSDRDLAVAAQASNSLVQTGSERGQEAEMQRLRDVLFETRQHAVEKYNSVYREVLSEDPRMSLRAPSIAPKYRQKPEGAGKKPPLEQFRRRR